MTKNNTLNWIDAVVYTYKRVLATVHIPALAVSHITRRQFTITAYCLYNSLPNSIKAMEIRLKLMVLLKEFYLNWRSVEWQDGFC